MLRRIVAFDYGVAGFVEMGGCVPVRRIIAAADMATDPAEPQMNPSIAALEAFLAPAGAGDDVHDHVHVHAGRHD
jgi:hypothetical protein